MPEVRRTILRVASTKAELSDPSPWTQANPNHWIPDPSSLQWGLQSVSDSDAGRDMSGTMHVNLVTRKRKLELAWNGVDFSTTSEILTAFFDETFWVEYLDAKTNTRLQREFYVGDRTAPVHSYAVGHQWYTTVAFNIIEV